MEITYEPDPREKPLQWVPSRGFDLCGRVSAGITMAPQIVDGQVFLRSDDGSWYRLRLATDEGMITQDIEQTPSVAPIGYLTFLPMEADDGFTYRISLDTEDGMVHMSIDPTPRTEHGFTSVTLRNITDGLYYVCTLIVDEGIPMFSPAQTP